MSQFNFPLAYLLTITIQYYPTSTIVDANATSDYSATLSLESITVPADFNAVDISGLSVVFDSGLTIPVTREGVLEPEPIPGTEPTPGIEPIQKHAPEPIPEPSSVLGTLIVSAFSAYSLLKRKLKKQYGSVKKYS